MGLWFHRIGVYHGKEEWEPGAGMGAEAKAKRSSLQPHSGNTEFKFSKSTTVSTLPPARLHLLKSPQPHYHEWIKFTCLIIPVKCFPDDCDKI